MSYLKLENITKRFGNQEVIKNLNLELGQGVFCVFLGPSGCGKSTLLNIIAGLENPTGGRIYLQGTDITDLPPHKRDIAMVFQNYALYPHLSVFENIAFGLKVKKIPQKEITAKVAHVSKILNISDKLDKYPRQLSGGERQRVATGRAIARNPNLFLFDEPLSNLDARLRMELRKEFLQLEQTLQKTSLYVTHDQIEALSLGDIIVVLNDGIIQQISPPQELYNEPENLFVANFIGTPPMNVLKLQVDYSQKIPCLVNKNLRINVPAKLNEKLKQKKYDYILLGIRPSSLKIARNKTDYAYVLSGIIKLTELLGDDLLVYLKIDDDIELKATFPNIPLAKQSKLPIGFAEKDLYFFSEAGSRIC
jgi:multiple sugar transport system ATP-binding protein